MRLILVVLITTVVAVSAQILYPTSGVTAFITSTSPTCDFLNGPAYRERVYQFLAPQLDTCYKCSGKAIKYENLNPYPNGGNIRQCVNLNNDCGGTFSCTDIEPGDCVQHPCISSSVVYGEWKLYNYKGYIVQPFDDVSCSNTVSLPPPYFYTDTAGKCTVFDNTTRLTPGNPKCTKWGSVGDNKSVQVCIAAEKQCNATSIVVDDPVCQTANGASCTEYTVDSIDTTGTCGAGSGWPFLGHPGAKVQFVDGPPLFTGSSVMTRTSFTTLVAALCILLMFV